MDYVINYVYNNLDKFHDVFKTQISRLDTYKLYLAINHRRIEVLMYCPKWNAFYFIDEDFLKNIENYGALAMAKGDNTKSPYFFYQTEEEIFQATLTIDVDQYTIPLEHVDKMNYILQFMYSKVNENEFN